MNGHFQPTIYVVIELTLLWSRVRLTQVMAMRVGLTLLLACSSLTTNPEIVANPRLGALTLIYEYHPGHIILIAILT